MMMNDQHRTLYHCPTCYGSGVVHQYSEDGEEEIGREDCADCLGAGMVSPAVAHIIEADRWVRLQDPEWSGYDRDHAGTTRYSLAMWKRVDFKWSAVLAFEGYQSTENGQMVDAVLPGGVHVAFHGVSWGYRGEGCNGLADLIASAWDVEHRWVMNRLVSRLDQDRSWRLEPQMLGEARPWEHAQAASAS